MQLVRCGQKLTLTNTTNIFFTCEYITSGHIKRIYFNLLLNDGAVVGTTGVVCIKVEFG